MTARVDLLLANGHPDDMIENYSQQVKYKEPIVLFHQENGKLRNVSAKRGRHFRSLTRRADWRLGISITTDCSTS